MKSSEIVEFVKSIPHGRMVGIEWVKSDGSVRRGSVCFGVKNPTNVTAPGKGIRSGVSFKDAIENNGVLKFFEPNAENDNGTKGGYRSAKLNRILSINYDGKHHEIEDNQHLRNN
jgi:hypothetical protein